MAKHHSLIESLIMEVKSKPAYTDNKEVRDLVNESEKSIREAAASRSNSALWQILRQMNLRLIDVIDGLGTVSKKHRKLPLRQQEALLAMVESRFEDNMHRHEGMKWAKVQAKLEANPKKMRSLNKMEETGGEPDVVGFDKKTGEYIFIDCSAESPEGRRLVCYNREGQNVAKWRKQRSNGNAIDMAYAMGIKLLTEAEYRKLQKLDRFDLNTVSWLKTPADIRKTGVVLCGFRTGGDVIVVQRDATDFGVGGGFRGSLRV